MTELYIVKNFGLYEKVKQLSLRHTTAPIEILRTDSGKPYIAGNPLYFSVSHSGDRAVIVLCDSPVGVDLELKRSKNFQAVLSRFSQRERDEIKDNFDFLIHWTAREAFVKMKGFTLWQTVKDIEYFGGNIYYRGDRQKVKITVHRLGFGIAAVCTKED